MNKPLRILFVPFGSEGDVNPLLWLAAHMARRGHHPVFLLTPHYGPLVARHNFEWYPVGTEEDFLRITGNPIMWKPVVGSWLVAAAMIKSLPRYAPAFLAAGATPFDLAVTSTFGLAGSALAEARGIPRLMLHLQPACMWSRHEPPFVSLGTGWLAKTAPPIKQAALSAMKFLLDHTLLPPWNNFRAGLGLPRQHSFYHETLMGSEGVALLFPPWFQSPQPDWPRGVRQFDFPIDPHTSTPLPPDLASWLAVGEPPVVWTHGSANFHVDRLHTLALRTTEIAGGRALLVSKKHPAHPLPGNVFHIARVPFENLFPRCRAVVHHAGVGTTAKAFAAGIPQLPLPLAHDQHDNATRIQHLGAGMACMRDRTPHRLALLLKNLSVSPEISHGVARCRELAARSPLAADSLCALAESLPKKSQPPAIST